MTMNPHHFSQEEAVEARAHEEPEVAATEPSRSMSNRIDTPAALLGMFAALGVLVFLGALFAAGAASLPFQLNAIDIEGEPVELAVGGVLIAALVVFVSFLIGGWTAGAIAREDGGLHGLAAALWALLLIAVFAALGAFLGAEYNAFQRTGLPDWFSQLRGEDVSVLGVFAAAGAVAAMFLGAYLGGRWGEEHHAPESAVTRRGHIA
jgi:MFS family permease